jgi:hypothetical protein
MPEMDQGIKRLLQVHPDDMIEMALPGAEYIAPLTTDVATEPQLVLDTLKGNGVATATCHSALSETHRLMRSTKRHAATRLAGPAGVRDALS